MRFVYAFMTVTATAAGSGLVWNDDGRVALVGFLFLLVAAVMLILTIDGDR